MSLSERMHDHLEDTHDIDRCIEAAYRRGVHQTLAFISYNRELWIDNLDLAVKQARNMRFDDKRHWPYLHELEDYLKEISRQT
jgi:hypothetical protein